MTALTMAPIAYIAWQDVQSGEPRWIVYFAIATISFFPGWLFIRFIKLRGTAIWQEYVIHLHRLGADRREFLPRPPVESEYFLSWLEARDGLGDYEEDQNIYREKFNAYYGRNFLKAVQSSARRPRTETLFPVLLCTAVFSIGWTTILSIHFGSKLQPSTMADMLSYAFAGAYLFILQMLIRRFFQSDLKSSAYASAFVRVVAVLLIVSAVSHILPLPTTSAGSAAAVAFIIGFFPIVGLQALRRTAQATLKAAVPSLKTSYPLSELDGVNLWYETRLLEEGIEDQEELVTANVVDVILHTRVPVGRLVDWLDQAHLYLHLPPRPQKQWRPISSRRASSKHQHDSSGEAPQDKLRAAGIRNASELLTAFGVYKPYVVATDKSLGAVATLSHELGEHRSELLDEQHLTARGEKPRRAGSIAGDQRDIDDPQLALAESIVGGQHSQKLLSVVKVLEKNTALAPVLNWRHWGAQRLYELERGEARDEPHDRVHRAKVSLCIPHIICMLNEEITKRRQGCSGTVETQRSILAMSPPICEPGDQENMMFPEVTVVKRAELRSWIPASDVLYAVEVVDNAQDSAVAGDVEPGGRGEESATSHLLRAYARLAVQNVWIVSTDDQTIRRYSLSEEGVYRQQAEVGGLNRWKQLSWPGGR
jgi:hypothetical protein